MITVIAKNWKALLAGIFISISVFVFFSYTNIGSGNQYIHKMRSSFHPSEDASYQVRVENRQRMKELMAKKPLGYGIGLSKASNFDSREQMPYLRLLASQRMGGNGNCGTDTLPFHTQYSLCLVFLDTHV